MTIGKAQEARHTSTTQFVDPKVLKNSTTVAILSQITPYFPKSAKVISGYLGPDDLYWKVNYHWDVLQEALAHCMGLDIAPAHRLVLESLRKRLLRNPPNPPKGYRKSQRVGEPKDRSSHAQIIARHALVTQIKREFKAAVQAAAVLSKTKRSRKALELAYAPVAKPTVSKHETGYALDIAGDNADVKRIASALGATVVFDEGSHVHCEWAHGVRRLASA